MIKGRTKIELTDVNTGERQEIVHDNMVTNGFLKFVNNLGGMSNALSSILNCFDPKGMFLEDMYSGVMLFDTPLNDDPDDLWIPSNTKCVAYGCDLANSGVNSMLGSYNVTESGLLPDGSYKFVWDFATNQGNGTIASLSLVPKRIVRSGWNNKQNEIDRTIANSYNYHIREFGVSTGGYVDMYLFYDEEYLYGIERGNLAYNSKAPGNYIVGTRKLRITKQLYPHKKMSIFNRLGFSLNRVVETIEITLPDSISAILDSVKDNTLYKHVECDQGYIYVYLNNSITVSANAKIQLLRISMDDWSTSVIEVTNTTGKSLSLGIKTTSGSLISTSMTNMRIVNGYLILSSGRLYVINLSNSADIKEALYEDDVAFTSSYFCSGLKYKDYLFFYTYNDFNSYLTYAHVLNIKTGEVFKIYLTSEKNACIPFYGYSSNHMIKHKSNEDFYHMWLYHSGNGYTCINPFVLMTKNNLDNAVTKTSAQTMKVTYILSETL